MEILNIDFEKLSPYIIDAFTKVYGDEYHDTISKKINNMHIFYYYNIDNLKEYIADIKMCKRREYAIRFLDKIGIDVKKYIKANYMDPLGEEVEEILKYYISSSFKKSGNKSSSIQQYHINNPNDPEISLANKLLIINHLLENNHEEITIENYERFKETREYQVILSKIKEINLVFNKLLTEYETWEEQLQPYDDFIDSEIERKLNILNDKKVATFNNIYAKLPISIKDAISNKTLEGQITSIFGSLDFGSSTPIEAFSSKNMEKLKSKNVNAFKRFLILSSQILYLKNIGIAIENYNLLTNSIDEIIKPIGTYHKKAIFVKEIANILVNNYDCKVPNDRKKLESMPGVGRKTTNVVLSNLFLVPTIAVDTHVSRVSKRLGLADNSDDVSEIELKLMKKFAKKNWSKRHHQMVLFGRYYCKAVAPLCSTCKLKNICNNNK